MGILHTVRVCSIGTDPKGTTYKKRFPTFELYNDDLKKWTDTLSTCSIALMNIISSKTKEIGNLQSKISDLLEDTVQPAAVF